MKKQYEPAERKNKRKGQERDDRNEGTVALLQSLCSNGRIPRTLYIFGLIVNECIRQMYHRMCMCVCTHRATTAIGTSS